MELTYHIVDVFTTVPLEGNPLAVFPDASGLDATTMQRIARELSLSETTFVLPRESDELGTRVRIFTPRSEMEFAGHPTIGTAYVLRRLEAVSSSAKEFFLRENVGPVRVRVDEGENPIIWLTTPPIEKISEYPRARCASMLGLAESRLVGDVPCELLTAGNPNIFIAVDSPAAVDEAQLNVNEFVEMVTDRLDPTCVFVFAPTKNGAYSRMFAPLLGIAEDPATGSATGPLALFMMKHGLIQDAPETRFISEQGTKMGRRSLLHVHARGRLGSEGIDVGGNVAELATATMSLPFATVAAA